MCFKIIKFQEINSTSVWARKNLNNLEDFDIVSAELQASGHGQFERKWFSSSSNGGNIYISIVLKPDNIEYLNELTRYTSLMTAETLKEYGVKPQFKYPNDVLISGKKIAGILAESVFLGQVLKGVVVGIGINLNLNNDEIKNINIPATSLFLETNKNINKQDFLEKFLNNFKKEYENFLKTGIKQELTPASK